jgi:hypothetical protein
MADEDLAPLETEKEILVYRGGWGFSLPDQHTVRVHEKGNMVSVHMPQRGGTYSLERIRETDDELRVFVAPGGPIVAGSVGHVEPGYPFPTIDEELQHLRTRWEQAGGASLGDRIHGDPGARQQFEAWAQGDDYDAKTTRMRDAVRELERKQTDSG